MQKQRIVNILLIVLGNLSLALGTGLFILPHKIINGGISGISIITSFLFSWDAALTILVINWLLFFVGFVVLGKKFALRTLLSTILYPLFLNIFTNISYFITLANGVTNTLLAGLTGAILIGFGLGIAYRAGASTGGLDTISLILKRKFKIKLSLSTLVMDSVIILLGLISISLEAALYGLLCVIVTSYLIEKITIGGTGSYMAHIVSDKSEQINDYLINVLQRGTTLISVRGGMTGNEKTMIEIVFNEKEYYDIKKSIYSIDNKAFISVYKSINAYGEGFDDIFIRRN